MKKVYVILALMLAIVLTLTLCACNKNDNVQKPDNEGQMSDGEGSKAPLDGVQSFDPTAIPDTCRSFGDTLLANQVAQNKYEKEHGQSVVKPTFDVEPAAKAAVPEGKTYLGYARGAFENMYMVFHTYSAYAAEVKIPTVREGGEVGHMNLLLPEEYSGCLSFRPVRGGSGGGSGECTVIIEVTEKNGVKFLEFDNFRFDVNQWQTFRFTREWTLSELQNSQYLQDYAAE